MPYPNSYPDLQQYPAVPPPAPKPRGGRIALILVGVALLAGLVAAIAIVGRPHTAARTPATTGLSQATAQRACRTAFGEEWDSRKAAAEVDTPDDVISAVQNIELLETWQSGDGYAVNGTIHYTLSTGLVGPIEESIDLTCTATGTDAYPSTTVTNRS